MISAEALAVLDRVSSELSAHVDVSATLRSALGELVPGIGCKAGWIVLVDRRDDDPHAGRGFTLAAEWGLPDSLSTDREEIWGFTCCCEAHLRGGRLAEACNEAECPRLEALRREHGEAIAHASAPLRWQGRDLGVLNLVKPDWAAYQEEELELVTRAAQLIAAALGRAQLYERMQRRIDEEHEALLELSRELLAHRELPELMKHMVESVRQLTASDACALLLPEADNQTIVFSACTGWRSRPHETGRRLRCDGSCSACEVMSTRRSLAIPDLRKSEVGEWAAPWIREEGFLAQAVVPLVAGESAVGVLVLHSKTVREWSASEMQFLHVMANQAAVALDTAMLRAGRNARHRIDDELAVARRIQGGLLPAHAPEIPGWRIRCTQEMARPIGGDFYDFLQWPHKPGRLGIAVGDAAGKGIGGALLMAQGLEALRSAAAVAGDPVEVLRSVNERVHRACDSGHFLTCFYGELDTETGDLRFASAGHERPLLYRSATGRLEEIRTPGAALGILPDCRAVIRLLRLEPGDALVLYSDGVTEARDAGRELFGERRLRTAVRRGARRGDALRAVMDAVRAFTGEAEASDDITVVVVERCPPGFL